MTSQSKPTSTQQHTPDARRAIRNWRNRTACLWRWAFLLFAIAATIATHWPQLQLPQQAPASDKALHALSFASLAILLWLTRWINRRTVVIGITLVWGAVDELTQGLPGVNRWVTCEDLLANTCGVLAAGAWLWAMRPIGGEISRTRQLRQRHVFDMICKRARTFVGVLIAVLSCTGVICITWLISDPQTTRVVIVAAVAVCIMAGVLLVALQWPAVEAVERGRCTCPECGHSCIDAARAKSSDQHRTCPDCGFGDLMLLWSRCIGPSAMHRRRALARVIAVGLVVCVLYVLAVLSLSRLHAAALQTRWLADLATSAAQYAGQNRSLMFVIDACIVALLLAILARGYRRSLAVQIDTPDRCMCCGYDLRGLDRTAPGARCSECGADVKRAVGEHDSTI